MSGPRLSSRDVPALSPIQWGGSLSGAPVSSGVLLGASPVLVRRWRGVAPDIEQPPLDQHYITLHLGGPKRIRRNGEGRVADGDIAEGAYSVTPAGSAFSWRTQGPVDFAHIYLRPSLIDRTITMEFDRDPCGAALTDVLGARDPLLEALLATLVSGLSRPDSLGRLYWEGVIHTLVHRLVEQHSNLSIFSGARHALAPSRVNRVTDFVEANLASDIALADLAAVAGVSAFHFTRGFHRATGHAPYAFVIHRRLEQAKVLLGETDLPLAEVARACGFGSHGGFSTAFKRGVGLSPLQYRLRQ